MYINSDVTLSLAHTSFDVWFVSDRLAKKKKIQQPKRSKLLHQKTLTGSKREAAFSLNYLRSSSHPGNGGRCGRYRNSSHKGPMRRRASNTGAMMQRRVKDGAQQEHPAAKRATPAAPPTSARRVPLIGGVRLDFHPRMQCDHKVTPWSPPPLPTLNEFQTAGAELRWLCIFKFSKSNLSRSRSLIFTAGILVFWAFFFFFSLPSPPPLVRFGPWAASPCECLQQLRVITALVRSVLFCQEHLKLIGIFVAKGDATCSPGRLSGGFAPCKLVECGKKKYIKKIKYSCNTRRFFLLQHC